MGCDIHVHTEIKVRGVWHNWSQPDVHANYHLFSKMAGVRQMPDREYGVVEPIAKPRGLPDDCSPVTAWHCVEHWGSDAHSVSWLSSEEVGELIEYCERHGFFKSMESWRTFGHLMGNRWESFLDHEDFRHSGDYPGVQDFRFVFWFDG